MPKSFANDPRLRKLQADVDQARHTVDLLEGTFQQLDATRRRTAGWSGPDPRVQGAISGSLDKFINSVNLDIKHWKQELDTRQATYIVAEEKAAGQRSFASRSEADDYMGKVEKVGRATGRLAGKGFSALGSRLQALETEPLGWVDDPIYGRLDVLKVGIADDKSGEKAYYVKGPRFGPDWRDASELRSVHLNQARRR